jgi:hypothetical protein
MTVARYMVAGLPGGVTCWLTDLAGPRPSLAVSVGHGWVSEHHVICVI